MLKDEEQGLPGIEQVWKVMSAKISELEGITYNSLSYTGKLIDGSAWAKLPFCEGKSMHYEPEKEKVSAGA